MKILFFTDHFRPEPSAPAAHVYERARLWSAAGHRVSVICAAPNFPEGRIFAGYRNRWRFVECLEGIRVVRVKTFIAPNEGFLLRVLDYFSYAISATFFAFFENKPDVILSTSPHIFVPLAASIIARIRRVPHVMEVRDLWPESIVAVGAMKKGCLYRALEHLELFLYQCADRIVTLTTSFREDIVRRGVNIGKIQVVVGGANLELFSPQATQVRRRRDLCLEGRFVVGYFGTLGMAHGLENVLAAADLLRNDRVVFLFVGEGAAKKCMEYQIRQRNLENVVMLPRQLREHMPEYLGVCDVSLVHLKGHELFSKVIPSKIFEAMAMGIPVLYVGPRGEGAEIVERHDVGVCVQPEDPAALVFVIRTLIHDKERCAQFACNGLKASRLYSREYQAARTMKVLRGVIKNGGTCKGA